MNQYSTMKKILMTLAVLFAALVACMAEPVSPSAAREAAAAFLQGKGITLDEAVSTSLGAKGQSADNQQPIEGKPYYVFNTSDLQGFVVVSGDDCVGENLVLGYTERGCFDAEEVPANLQWWLDQISSQITQLSLCGAKASKVTLHDDVPYLMTTLWNQGENILNPKNPYNACCPETDGQLCLTGCMATALSQVLYYHRWPQDPIQGNLPAYEMLDGSIMEELPATAFDWDKMVDDYTQPTTDEQQAAVAKLMRYCGQLVQMNYTPQLSSGIAYDLDMLVKQFGYAPGVYAASAENYSVSAWDNLLYNELKEGRPIVYNGKSTGGGHAFVIDGYKVQDGSGYFHVNWGWSGDGDGYFKISLLNPYMSGAGGSTTSDGYNQRQGAIIGLQPRTGTVSNYGRYLDSYAWNEKDFGLEHLFAVLNSSHMPGTFDIALAECNDEGMPDCSRLHGMQSFEVSGYSIAGMQKNLKDILLIFTLPEGIAEELTPGSHRLMFVHREASTDAEWRPLFGYNRMVEFVIGDDKMNIDTLYHPLQLLTCPALKIEGLMQRGLRLDVTATVANNGNDDLIGTVECDAYIVENDTLKARAVRARSGIMIEGETVEDVSFLLTVPQAGQYVVTVTKNDEDMSGLSLEDMEHAQGYIVHKSISIDELDFRCLDIAYNERTDEKDQPACYLDVTVRNDTPLDYDAVLLARIYKPDNEGGYEQVSFPAPQDLYTWLEVTPNMEEVASIRLPQPLDTGEYCIELLIANDFQSKILDDYFVFAEGTVQVTSTTAVKGTEDMMSSGAASSGKWHDLCGRRLDRHPTTGGVYIAKGRKVIVRK